MTHARIQSPQRKNAMRTVTPESKLVLALTVADARDMYSRDATTTLKGKAQGEEVLQGVLGGIDDRDKL